jgi:transposase-like protein
MLAVIDGSKALRVALRKYCGERGLVQRCQLHKRRNVCGHFADENATHWDRKLARAYDQPGYRSAKKALQRILRGLVDLNPSAARSLEEGLEETLTLHRLNALLELRRTFRSMNPIESACGVVRLARGNVKGWRPADQLERWAGSGLLVAERQFRRIVGFRALPRFLGLLEEQRGQVRSGASVA